MTDCEQGSSGRWNGAGELGNGTPWVWLYHQVDLRIYSEGLFLSSDMVSTCFCGHQGKDSNLWMGVYCYREKMGNKTIVICTWYSDDTSYLDDAQFLIGCWKLGKWFIIACLVGMLSHVLSHNRAADGEDSRSWLVILFSFQRLLLPFGI